MSLKTLDVVQLRERLAGGMDDGSDVPAGAVGTIVDTRQEGANRLYLVEFCDEGGRTMALVGLTEGQVEAA